MIPPAQRQRFATHRSVLHLILAFPCSVHLNLACVGELTRILQREAASVPNPGFKSASKTAAARKIAAKEFLHGHGCCGTAESLRQRFVVSCHRNIHLCKASRTVASLTTRDVKCGLDVSKTVTAVLYAGLLQERGVFIRGRIKVGQENRDVSIDA